LSVKGLFAKKLSLAGETPALPAKTNGTTILVTPWALNTVALEFLDRLHAAAF
jgi:hypothetical protein